MDNNTTVQMPCVNGSAVIVKRSLANRLPMIQRKLHPVSGISGLK